MPLGPYEPGLLPADHRAALLDAVGYLIDHFTEDLASMLAEKKAFAETFMATCLPAKYLLRYTPGFAKQFLACTIMVGWKMVDTRVHWPACLAEELALLAIVETAQALLELEAEEGEEEVGKIDFSTFLEVATKDSDYLFLFGPARDGIEDTEVGQMMQMVHLHFDDWFKPFPMRQSGVPHPLCFRSEGDVFHSTGPHDAPEEEEEERGFPFAS